MQTRIAQDELSAVAAPARAQHSESGTTVPVVARTPLEREMQKRLICMCRDCGRQLLSACQCGYAFRMRAELAQLPKHSFSLWNKYDITARWGAGLGVIHRSDMFASGDNLVTLPGYTRFDGGLFVNVTSKLRAQLNVENLFDEDYHLSAHNNTNITPGSPRALRLTLTTRF